MLVALDRDLTVDVGRWADRRDPHQRLLSLEFVRWLAHETEAEVWAIGNQDLVDEADIPGMETVRERLEEGDGLGDLVWDGPLGYPSRPDRVRLVGRLFPDIDRRVVVDDTNLAQLEEEGWAYYPAWEFIEAVERHDIVLPEEPAVPITNHDAPSQ